MIDFIKQDLEAALAKVSEYERQLKAEVTANVERLSKAMEREQKLKDEMAEIQSARAADNAKISELERTIEQMHDHPTVKARLLREAEAEFNRAQERVLALMPKE